jgi:CDGSH-type Zn-finger protein
MSEPHIARKLPYAVEVEAGKTYSWCACGLSQTQPFCDGSHKATDITPVVHQAEETGKAFYCGCKHSQNPPYCDGTHGTL